MELRRKIIETLESIEGYRGLEHERQADAILAIPEIKEALACRRALTTGDGLTMTAGPPILNP